MKEPPQELRDLPQWCVWFYLRRGDDVTKPPCNPLVDVARPLEERLARPNDPNSWGTYRQARERYLSPPRVYRGVGFFFTQEDAYCGVDLDHCVTGGNIAPWAREVMQCLNSYTELSPSGKGVHILIKASLQVAIEHLDRNVIQHKDPTGRLEIYDSSRYFTWTGRAIKASPIESRQQELTVLYQAWFPEKEEQCAEIQLGQALDLSNQELIDRAGRARGGNGARFRRLWSGDRSDYRDPQTGEIDESRADLALLGILAFWTGRDPARMESLFRQSGLYRPERWNAPARSGETYGAGSIRVAIENCPRVYTPKSHQ